MLTAKNIATMDVNMLLSVVNLHLRNEYSTLASLCASYELDENTLVERLKEGGFTYAKEINQFRNTL